MNRRNFLKSAIIGTCVASVPLAVRASEADLVLYQKFSTGIVHRFCIPITTPDGEELIMSFTVENSDGTATVAGKTYYGERL